MSTLSSLVQQAQLVQKEKRADPELAETLRKAAESFYQPNYNRVTQTTGLDHEFINILKLVTAINVSTNKETAGNYRDNYVILARGEFNPAAIEGPLTIHVYLAGKVELLMRRKLKSRIYAVSFGVTIPDYLPIICPLINKLTSAFDSTDEKYSRTPEPRARNLQQQLAVKAKPGYTYITMAREQTRHNMKISSVDFFDATIDFHSPPTIDRSLQRDISILARRIMKENKI